MNDATLYIQRNNTNFTYEVRSKIFKEIEVADILLSEHSNFRDAKIYMDKLDENYQEDSVSADELFQEECLALLGAA